LQSKEKNAEVLTLQQSKEQGPCETAGQTTRTVSAAEDFNSECPKERPRDLTDISVDEFEQEDNLKKQVDPFKILRKIKSKVHRNSGTHLDSHHHLLQAMERMNTSHELESPFWSKLQESLNKVAFESRQNSCKRLRSLSVIGRAAGSSYGANDSRTESGGSTHSLLEVINEPADLFPEKNSQFGVMTAVNLKMKARQARKKIHKVHRGMILPHNPMKIMFDVFVGMLIIYSVITIPVGLAFGGMDSLGFRNFEIALDAVFLFDMVLTFFTAISHGRRLIYDRRVIASSYLRGMFLPDLLSSFPFNEVVQSILGSGASLKALRMIRIIRVVRILRLLKLGRLLRLSRKLQAIDLANTFQVDPAIITLLSRMSKILYVAHLACCVWYLLNDCVSEELSWVKCGANGQLVSRYLASLYFTLYTMMTIGYGDVPVLTSAQRCFSMMLQVSGPLTFGVIVSSISEVVDSLDTHTKHLQERMSSVKEYLGDKKLPYPLTKKIHSHFVYFYTHTTVFREQNIIKHLPHSVYLELINAQHQKHLKHLCFFKHFMETEHTDFVYTALPLLRPMLAQAGETIAIQGDPAEEVYFVKKGQINGVMTIKSAEPVLIGVYHKGSTLNLANVIRYTEMHCTLRAACLSDLLWLDLEDLEMMLAMFPEVASQIQGMVKTELEKTMLVLESPTLTKDAHLVKAMILYEPSEQHGSKVVECMHVEIEPIKGVFHGHHKRTIRTIKFKSVRDTSVKMDPNTTKKIYAGSLDVKMTESEETPESLHRRFLIDPMGPKKLRWDIFISCLTIYSGLWIPVRIGFYLESKALNWFDGFVDCFYLLDIIFTFRTLDEAAPELFFADAWVIAVRYLASWFCIDLLSALPLDNLFYILNQYTHSMGTKGLRLVRISRVFRFFKLMRLFKIAKRFKGFGVDLGAYSYYLNQLILLFVFLLYIGHLFGCLWGFVAFQEGIENSWLSVVSGIETATFLMDEYIASVYWAFTTITTVGYGDITPRTDRERAYAAVVFVFGSTVYAFIVSNVSSLAYQLSTLKKMDRKNVSEINEYLAEQKVGFDLSVTIRKQMLFAFACMRAEAETQILKRLPCLMRRETLLQSQREIIDTIPIFRDTPASFISIVMQRMVPEFSQANTTIYTPSVGSKGLYFLINGVVEEVKIRCGAESVEDYDVLCIAEKGGFFGYRNFLNLTTRNIGARAFTDCYMYVLTTQEMTNLDEKFQSVAHQLSRSLIRCFTEQNAFEHFSSYRLGSPKSTMRKVVPGLSPEKHANAFKKNSKN